MKKLARFGLIAGAASCFVACGGPQVPTAPLGVVPQAGARSPVRARMDAGAAKWDLLYVTNAGQGVVNVYRYWQHNLVGILTDATYPFGACADASGNVYIADFKGERIFEYAHGGKKAIKKLDVSPYEPENCSVNPRTGDLAIANYEQYSGCGSLAIFRHATGKPLYFTTPLCRYAAVAYDDKGNLLTTDGDYNDSGYGSSFALLPKNGIKLVPISMHGGSSRYGNFNGVVDIVWDGKYFVVNASYYALDLTRVRIKNGQGNAVGVTSLGGGPGNMLGFAIYNNTVGGQGTQVVATVNYKVGYWKYPAGGSPIAEITKNLDQPFGVAVSLKQQ